MTCTRSTLESFLRIASAYAEISNCLSGQEFDKSAALPIWTPKAPRSNCPDYFPVYVVAGCHAVWFLTIVLMMTRSFRMVAVKATFLGLPALQSRS